jgi:hypothetical protein
VSEENIETRIAAIEDGNSIRDERIEALSAEIDEIRQLLGRSIASKAQAIAAARTAPMSQDMAMTGRSPNPEQFDAQEAMLRSRSGDRKANVPGPVQYGEGPAR